MKKLIIIITLAIFITFPVTMKDLTGEYQALKMQYPLMQQRWFMMIVTECFKYNIDPADICAIIEHEGKWNPTVISKPNKDGSFDMSLMQVNSKHDSVNPMRYFPVEENIKKGVYEYHLCLEKANGDKKTANRFYNAGRNNVAKNYKNWVYVEKIDKSRQSAIKIKLNFFTEK